MISCCRKKHNAFAILNGMGESKRYLIEILQKHDQDTDRQPELLYEYVLWEIGKP